MIAYVYVAVDPDPSVARFIDRYWFVRAAEAARFALSVDVYVDAQADLVLNFGPPYRRRHGDGTHIEVAFSSIDAQRTSPVVIEQEGNVQVCGARFHPGGLAAFTRTDMAGLTNRIVPTGAVFGEAIEVLEGELSAGWTSAAVEELAARLDAFFVGALVERRPYTTFLRLVEAIDRAGPLISSVDDLADRAELSQRTIERLFGAHMGITPKLYLRIARFQRALTAMMDDPECDLATVALGEGYYDQSHLVREFHAFAGGVPQRYKGYLPETGADFAPNVVRYDDPPGR